MHARCMLDRAERPASGHADPHPCVACRCEWPARNWSLHPAELAEDLPRPRPGARWSAVAGALKFAEILEEDGPRLEPASDVTTGFHDTIEEMVRTIGRSLTSSFLFPPLFTAMLLLCSKGSASTSPDRGNGERQLATTAIFSPRTLSSRRTLCSDSRIKGSTAYPTPCPRVSGGPRLHMEDHLTRWNLRV